MRCTRLDPLDALDAMLDHSIGARCCTRSALDRHSMRSTLLHDTLNGLRRPQTPSKRLRAFLGYCDTPKRSEALRDALSGSDGFNTRS